MATIKISELHPVVVETSLTELTPSEQRGVHGAVGILGVLFVAGAAFLLSGCTSCTGHGRASKKPTKSPGN